MSRARNRHKVLGGIGSYWGEHVHEESAGLLRDFVHLPDSMEFQGFTEEMRHSFAGSAEIQRENFVIAFDPDTVVEFGADQQARILERYFDAEVGATLTVYRKPLDYEILQGFAPMSSELDGYILTSETCEYLVWPIASVEQTTADPNVLENAWEVAIPYGIYPETILVGDQVLTAGIDFKVFEGALQFEENPHGMFENRKIHVLQGRKRITNRMSHALGMDDISHHSEPITRFFRETTNGPSLQAAVARASGMISIPQDGILLDSREDCGKTTYMFDWGVLTVPYAHEALVKGTRYEAGTIPGDLIRVHAPTGNPGWYTAVDWGEQGLSLDRLCPFKGIIAPNHSVKFWAYAQTGSKFHVRAQLSGDSAAQESYWNFIKRGEELTGNYLNDVLEFSALNESVQLNPIEFFFRHLLADQMLVVELRTLNIAGPIHERALSFLTEHRIVGSLLTVIES